jgi:hypothetical protein
MASHSDEFRKNARWVRVNNDVYRMAPIFEGARTATPITEEEAIRHFASVGADLAALGMVASADPEVAAVIQAAQEGAFRPRGRKKAQVVMADEEIAPEAVAEIGVPEA